MKSIYLMLVCLTILSILLIAGLAGAEVSYEGTSKGTVISRGKAESSDFTATKQAGPWTKEEKNSRRTVAVIPIGNADEKIIKLLNNASSQLRDLLLKESGVIPISKEAVDKVLTDEHLQVWPNGAEIAKARDCLLSSYDVAVFVWSWKGWLIVSSYHAVSSTKALSHGFSVYIGNDPSDADLAKSLDEKVLIKSIETVLEKGISQSSAAGEPPKTKAQVFEITNIKYKNNIQLQLLEYISQEDFWVVDVNQSKVKGDFITFMDDRVCSVKAASLSVHNDYIHILLSDGCVFVGKTMITAASSNGQYIELSTDLPSKTSTKVGVITFGHLNTTGRAERRDIDFRSLKNEDLKQLILIEK